jgi:histidinol-phosphate aminotransferase
MSRFIRESVRKMTAYTPGEQPADTQIVKLNTNENPYPPSPRVAQALRELDPERLRLYPDPVSMDLRKGIAALHGCGVESVFAGNGSDEILALCTRAYVEDRGSIGYFVPSYSLYPVLADIRVVEQRPVDLGPEFDWKMPDSYSCSLFFLTNPNAPTAILYPPAQVMAFCERLPGVVVIDEAYVDFSRESCLALALERDNVLVVRTLSKSYSLAGLRVGYAVGHPDLVAAMYKLKDSYNLDRLSQALALAAISDQAHMRMNVGKIKTTRRRLSEALAGLGFVVYPSESNFVWARPAGKSAGEVFEALRRQRILVRYFPGGRTGDFLRITVGTDAEADRLIAALTGLAV